MPTWGYHPPAGGAPDTATPLATTMLGYTPDAPTENGWLYAVGIRCRRHTGTSPSISLNVYAATAGGTPTTKGGDCAAFTVSSGVDAEYQRDLNAAVMLSKGVARSLAVAVTGADLDMGMTQAANIPQADDTLFYWDYGLSTQPGPAVFDVDASSIEGWLGIWGLYESNVAPKAPASVAPGSTSQAAPQQIGTAAPTFTFGFADDNEALPNGLSGDKLKRGRVYVKTTAGALVWDSGSVAATSAMQTARQMTVAYTGPALANGTTYVLLTSVSDQFDAWSPTSAERYFTIGAGRVDVAAASPTGKTNTQTPGPFVAVWRHTGGLATNAVEVRIRDRDSGAPVRTSATLLLAVANNGTISVGYATAFGTAVLPWDDERLAWSMRGRDTANNFSGWSDDVAFWTNDPPAVPALVAPPANQVVTAPPLLAATCADTDDAGTQLTLKVRLKNAGGTVLGTRTMAWNATLSRYEYQCVAGDFAAFATYGWDCYGFDGHVWSGGATVEANAGYSASRQFVYAQGPLVAISSPTDGATVTTNTPTIVWTCPTQVKRTIAVVREGVTIHTITATSAGHGYTLPPLLSSGEQLHELDQFTVTVTCFDSNNLTGSASASYTLDYPPVTPLQPSVFLLNGRNDVTPSVVKITWPRSDYTVDQFRYYRLERRISADMLAANPALPAAPVVFKRTELGQNSYTDWEAVSGVTYEYRLRQYVVLGADTQASATRSAEVTVQFATVIIHDVKDPPNKRLVFDARRERTISTVVDFAVVSPWNQAKPVQFESDVNYQEVDVTLVLYAKGNDPATWEQAANYDLYLLQQQVREGGILCYRDGRGNKLYGRWASGPVVTDPPGGRVRTVRGVFRELAYDEGSKD